MIPIALFYQLNGRKFRLSYENKKEAKNQESIQSSITPDPEYRWESDNFTIRHHKQEVSPLPVGDQKTSINRRARKHNKNKTELT